MNRIIPRLRGAPLVHAVATTGIFHEYVCGLKVQPDSDIPSLSAVTCKNCIRKLKKKYGAIA